MPNRRTAEIFFYRLLDWFMASLAWFLFFICRKKIETPSISIGEITKDEKLLLGLVIIPIGWIILYSIFDKRADIYRYSRFNTLVRTLVLSLLGSVFIFFTVLIDDSTYNYTSYLVPVCILFVLHFSLTALARMLFLSWTKLKLKRGQITYKTIVVGNGPNATSILDEFNNEKNILGFNILGLIAEENSQDRPGLKVLGSYAGLSSVIEKNQVEEVILALETDQEHVLSEVLLQLQKLKDSILIKAQPEMYGMLLGKQRMSHHFSTGLLQVDQDMINDNSLIFKRLFDLVVSFFSLVILSPICLLIALLVKISSKGPVFYKQERIGMNSLPFTIIKFRSMYLDAEKGGPQLASTGDDRRTPIGKFIRKWRLDEIPQFFNVLKGDMSLVGPRPERQFFIDQIVKEEPLYEHLLTVRPGITSWGQVKYGYASSVSQMLKRLRYDLVYIENMSLGLDVKIMFYTVWVLLKGEGK